MRYVILKKYDANIVDIDIKFHKVHDEFVIINEKELMFSKAKGDTFEKKVKSVNGEIVDMSEAIRFAKSK